MMHKEGINLIRKNNLLYKINIYALLFASFVIVFLSLTRLANLILFGNQSIIQNNIAILDDLFIMGLRFDFRIIGIVLLIFIYIPYLILIWKKNKNSFLTWVKNILSIVLALIVILSFIDIGYFVFFGTPIDILIFGLLEDDTGAVIKSGISDPRLLLVGFITIISLLALIYLFLKVTHKLTLVKFRFIPNKAISLVLIIPLLMLAARGSVDTFPLSNRESSISTNSFINSLTQNAVFHLDYAYQNRKKNSFNLSSADVLKKANVENSEALIKKAGFDNNHPLKRKTPFNKHLANKPPHVIFVQMEGWSSHIALKHTDKNPILGRFKKHADQDYFLPYFFSNKYGTNPTIESILLNSPITPLSQSSAYKTQFSLSNILPFKREGYEVDFISGGYSSWRNHDVFWPKQGFDHYIDRSIIEEKYQISSDNPWGVYDEYLFKYMKDKLISAKNKQPTFSYILTTNNHSPIRLPADYKPPNFDLNTFGFKRDLDHKQEMLAGYHYQTDALGAFLDWLKNSNLKNEVIVVATGDHILKGFDDYNSAEKQFLRYGVATYFYIPKRYNKLSTFDKSLVTSLYGSHADLFPTLFELSLSGAEYYAFGTSLTQKMIRKNSYGWCDQGSFISHEGVVNTRTYQLYHWNTQDKVLLQATNQSPSTTIMKQIKTEQYRAYLKEWILYKDKESLTQNSTDL